jgi:hypothetical protein
LIHCIKAYAAAIGKAVEQLHSLDSTVQNTFDRPILEPQDRHRRMNETTFDVIPTQDESGYWVRICSKDRCCDAFVSSMHLTEDKKPQLMKCILKS